MAREGEEILKDLADGVLNLDEELAVRAAHEAVAAGLNAFDAISNGLVTGMNQAGKLYDDEEYFVPELLICSDAMYAALDVLKPHLQSSDAAEKFGCVIGVVEGDTHDIGKNLVKIMLDVAGFEMHDLGRNVPLADFVVDVVFLGYGYCQSLKGLDQEFDFPVILPQVDDCIALLLTPERYAEEIRKEVGTWFMTPGWAEIGADMIIKELRLDRVAKYGKNPLDMARRLFTHYKRGLYISTGVAAEEKSLSKAREFCGDFKLSLECTSAEPVLLATWLRKCLPPCEGASKERKSRS